MSRIDADGDADTDTNTDILGLVNPKLVLNNIRPALQERIRDSSSQDLWTRRGNSMAEGCAIFSS